MDISSLTIAQCREIAAMFGNQASKNMDICDKQSLPERAVLVTTDKSGVFFGYATDTSGDIIRLRACRNCIYWSDSIKGFLGLTTTGPDKDCRIGPASPFSEIRGITSVSEVSDIAVKAWESAPWKS